MQKHNKPARQPANLTRYNKGTAEHNPSTSKKQWQFTLGSPLCVVSMMMGEGERIIITQRGIVRAFLNQPQHPADPQQRKIIKIKSENFEILVKNELSNVIVGRT